MCAVRSFPLFWKCARSVLIQLHRSFAKTFGVIRGFVKLCESLATSLFEASAAYLACVAEDTYSCVCGNLPFIERHTDLRESFDWRPEGRFCGARALKPRYRGARGPLPAIALLVPMAFFSFYELPDR